MQQRNFDVIGQGGFRRKWFYFHRIAPLECENFTAKPLFDRFECFPVGPEQIVAMRLMPVRERAADNAFESVDTLPELLVRVSRDDSEHIVFS